MVLLVGLALAGGAGLRCAAAAETADGPAASPDSATEPAPELRPIDEAHDVQPGSVVHLEYALRSDTGQLLDGTRGRAPLVVTIGRGELIPGLERALQGMKVGERKQITVTPAEAYGPVDPDAVTEVALDRVPPTARRVGARLLAQTRSGRELWARVREVKDGTVVLDLNHPLAGQTLLFDVTVILIEPP